MSNKYNIGKIRIVNFKHIDVLNLNFSGNDLVLLEGPNGYGKTTIFDAIELVTTGKIKRIKNLSDRRSGFDDILFLKDKEKDSEIRIEFYNDFDFFTIVKHINASSEFSKKEKQPENWDIFKTYKLNSFNEELNDKMEIKADQVGSFFNLIDFERYFNLFYYIQQEDNTIFLQESEKERMEKIATLFDTSIEQKEKEKFEEIDKIVAKELKEKDIQITNVKNELANIESEMVKSEHSKGNIEYFSLFEELELEWDQRIDSISNETKEKYINEIKELYSLVENYDEMQKKTYNKQIYKYLNEDFLEQTVLFGKHLENYNEIKMLKTKERKIKKLKKSLEKKKFEKILEANIVLEAADELDIYFDDEIIDIELRRLRDLKNETNQLSKNVGKLKRNRSEILEIVEKHQSEINQNECPMCGYDYNTSLVLLDAINKKEERLENLLNEDYQEYEKKYDNFYKEVVEVINNQINKYIYNYEYHIDDKFFELLTKSFQNKDRILAFLRWSKDENLKIVEFLSGDFEISIKNNENKKRLKTYLNGLIKKEDNDYSVYEKNLKTFKNILNENGNITNQLNTETIKEKIAYINQQYFNLQSIKISEVKNEIKIKNAEIKKLEQLRIDIRIIIKTYREKIADHWEKIIKDIEIPFYIYSGKIIQNYQQGQGIFIKVIGTNQNTSIRFVADSSFDHDVKNYFSSGQLSALIIAFTLALNKVYGEKSIDLLMIDDPVQTLDEINIASLTELLRNEFSSKQIILSTHENDISRYISYKFLKYGLTTLKLNMKEEIHSY